MSQRINISSGSVWEDKVGYSRVVKIGNLIEVSGTTAIDDQGKVQGKGSFYDQTNYILGKIETNLQKVGASLNDVIRTRVFVTDISQWEEVGMAHGTYFKHIKPVTSMIEVSRLIDPELLVEIEVTAFVKK